MEVAKRKPSMDGRQTSFFESRRESCLGIAKGNGNCNGIVTEVQMV